MFFLFDYKQIKALCVLRIRQDGFWRLVLSPARFILY